MPIRFILSPLLALALFFQGRAMAQSPADLCPADSIAETLRETELQASAGICLSTPLGKRLLVAWWYGSGPASGTAKLLTWRGEPLDSIEIGRDPSFDVRPVSGEPYPEIVLRQETGWGTGAAELGLSVIRIRHDSLIVIFGLDTGSWFYPVDPVGGGRDSSEVSFPAQGIIEQRGVRQRLRRDSTGSYRPDGSGCRYYDRYVWNRDRQVFALAGVYATSAHSRCVAT